MECRVIEYWSSVQIKLKHVQICDHNGCRIEYQEEENFGCLAVLENMDKESRIKGTSVHGSQVFATKQELLNSL